MLGYCQNVKNSKECILRRFFVFVLQKSFSKNNHKHEKQHIFDIISNFDCAKQLKNSSFNTVIIFKAYVHILMTFGCNAECPHIC